MITENHIEQLCLTWFQDPSWEFLYGPDIAPDGDTPERSDYRQILLPGRVLEALQRLNPQVPQTVLDDVLHRLAKPEQLSLIQNNRAFHDLLRDGVPEEYDQDGEKRGDRVRLIDFAQPERNRFLVVNQFTVQGTRHTRRPDIVAFINGLPVAVIELKNLADEQTDIWAAFNQLQTYKAEIPDLFVFNEALVIFDGLKARVGSLTADRERFMPWRTIRNENDKPRHDHSLMQAIARVNRVFREKQGGLVVDYIGLAAELRKALKTYADNRGRGTPTLDTNAALARLKESLDIVQGIFSDFDYQGFRERATHLLLPAANYVLDLVEDRRKRFFDHVVIMTRAFSLCGTLDEALSLREEIAFFQAVKAVIAKATTSDKKLEEERKNQILKQILDNAVVAQGVQDIFALAGLERPDISILSDAFLEEVRQLPQRNFAVELLQKLLNDQIKSRTRHNVVLEKKFSDRLQEALNRYRSRAIESAQIIEELIAMAKEFREAAGRGERLGLNEAELAFYDALADNESAVRELGDATLKKIALELTEKLRNNTSVDWQKRESVRARLRNLVRITLRRYKYPPDKQDAAIDLVLRQAEKLSEDWHTAL